MSTFYTTVAHAASDKFEEKRSVFIGHAAPAKTEEDAMAFIKSKQNEYRDATHNVWAYYMKDGIVARYSDDGEPTGTAGLPVLETIRKSGVNDVCVVVTRYFGGILLGAPGLVRAYSKGASVAIAAAEPVTFEPFTELSVVCNYSDYQKILNELPKFGVKTDSSEFDVDVKISVAVKESLGDGLIKRISELTAARAQVTVTGSRMDN